MLLGYFVIGQIISIWKVLGAIWNFLEKTGYENDGYVQIHTKRQLNASTYIV